MSSLGLLFLLLLLPPLLLVLIVIVRILDQVIRYQRKRSAYAHLPHPHPSSKLPILMRQFGDQGGAEMVQEEAFNKEKGHYEDLTHAGFMFGGTHQIHVNHPDYIREILSNPETFVKGEIYQVAEDFMGSGLLTATGEIWRHDRRLLTPGFHGNFLRNLMPVMNQQAAEMVETLRKLQGQPAMAFTELSHAALGIIVESSVGSGVVDIPTLCALFRQTTDAFNSHFLSQLLLGPFASLIPFDFAHPLEGKRRLIKEIIQRAIDTRRAQLKEKAAAGEEVVDRDFLSLMLRFGDFDDAKLMDESITFFFAGHDTTASALSWCMYFLIKYPEQQRRLREHLDEKGFDLRNLTLERLQAFPLLRMFFFESLRLRPPVLGLSRDATKDVTFGEFFIPKGSVLTVEFMNVQNDPRFWPEPDTFKPERFEKDEGESSSRHPFAFVAFSGGPRNCIGRKFAEQEAMILLGAIVANFHVEGNLEGVCIDSKSLSRPKDLMVSFVPRQR